ncbi:hypothetical protein [Streptomyces sp. NPDC054887]
MAPMQRGFVHAVAWSLATGAAVTLSWWGVHTVMSGTAYDAPQALPIPTDLPARGGAPQGAKPQASSTRRPASERADTAKPSASPARSGSPTGTPGRATPSPSRTPDGPTSPPASGARSGAPADGQVKSYSTDGGRVTFDLGKTSASLVSATPATGWSMQVWKDPNWIRVEFTGGAASVSVFCTWHHHAPTVEIVKS